MIYFDHNATTPLDPRVLDAMAPYLGALYGNPSSLHRLGRVARAAVDTARSRLAALVGCEPSNVIFTSSGTEADNLALFGMAAALPAGVLAIGGTEHPAVVEPAKALASRGWQLETLDVDLNGNVADTWRARLDSASVRLASVMFANNETGVIQNLKPLADWLHDRGAWLHTDAVQAAGKVPLDFAETGADLMSLSSHKLYGPKGAGALIIKSSVPIKPLLFGGGQENEHRGGTENVAAIVGFGLAAELARLELSERIRHVERLRERLAARLLDCFPAAVIFAPNSRRLPNTLQFALPGIDGEALVMALDRRGIAVSSGSACASGAGEPSPVLTAMGYPGEVAKGAVRISLGKDNTTEDVDRFIEILSEVASGFGPSLAGSSVLTS